ncbi:hypothetical protein ATI61_11997 [Archangium gephyra]|uniref:Uncharacterized protein n=1 Tax=Archangium gephyra TaxID=48 RepID=A0AAC8Q9Q6_9BACT|nr:hypothetical protein [Archangium gephyra]AKJ03652.1 Hypothetical protein AA314_05278 [Archangium gephyra]REG22567.1 hypothetical protein ATI61_11997 [Archangium gephyra]
MLGLLLTSLVAHAAPSEQELREEGLCELRYLFQLQTESAAQGSFPYYNPAFHMVGFEPLPCPDGKRPRVDEPYRIGGCHFVYGIDMLDPAAGYTAFARGAPGPARGLEFHIDQRGPLTGTSFEGLDCEAYRARKDPLWRWREPNRKHRCCEQREADPVCREALGVLVEAHRTGVTSAREPYEGCAAAQGLDPRRTEEERLCAPGPSFPEREQLARNLAKRGTLVSALARPGCELRAQHASVDILSADFERLCRSEDCPTVLGRMRAAVPGPQVELLLARHVDRVFPLLKRKVEKLRSPHELAALLSELLALDRDTAFELATLLNDEVDPGSRELQGKVLGLRPEPLTVRLLQSAQQREWPGAAGVAGLVLEVLGQGELPDAQLRPTLERVPCSLLAHTRTFIETRPGLAKPLWEQLERRCPFYEDDRWFALAHLTPAEFEQRVAQVGCDKVPWRGNVMRDDRLGFESKGSRLEEHFGWIGRRCPEEAWNLLVGKKTHLTPGLAEQAVSPEQLRRFRFRGNPEWALGELITSWERRSLLTPEFARGVARAVAREVTGETDRGTWLVRGLARLKLPPGELRETVAPLLASAKPQVRTATAALLARTGAGDIPRPVALACAREHEALTTCVQDAIRAVGPRPGSSHGLTLVPPGSDPFYGKGPPTEAFWCTLMNSRLHGCEWNPCTGKPLTGEALSRLAAAAGVSLQEVPEPPPPCAQRKADSLEEHDLLPWSVDRYFLQN